MYTTLAVRYEDLEDYKNGIMIMAAPNLRGATIIFENARAADLMEVSVDIDEILSRKTMQVRGMSPGTYPYYEIKKVGHY